MNRRVFLLHVGGLGGVVMGPRRYGYAGPASEGHAVAEDLLDARLLTPEPRQVALRKASVSLDATWGVSVVEPRDGRAAELASRLISQVARLGGPYRHGGGLSG